MKQYFEFKDEKSSKFWEIELDGTHIQTRYGKINTTGQTSEKSFKTEAEAQKEYEKLIKEKTKKGYNEVKTKHKPKHVSAKPIYAKNDWEEVLQGFHITDAAVRDKNILYVCGMWNEEDENIFRLIALFLDYEPGNNWGYKEFYDFLHPQLGVSRAPFVRPSGMLSSCDENGSVWPMGGGKSGPMEMIAKDKNPTPHKLKCINGYTYALCSSLSMYKRVDDDKWSLFAQMPATKKEISHSRLTDLDAFSENDMVAVGDNGKVWHWQGTAWEKIDFPEKNELATVTCAGDGKIYITDISGNLWTQDKNSWKMLHQGLSGIPWNDVLWFNNKLWLASDKEFCVWEDNALKTVSDKGTSMEMSGHMDCADGVLVIASRNKIMRYDGTEWACVVAPFEEKKKKAESKKKKSSTIKDLKTVKVAEAIKLYPELKKLNYIGEPQHYIAVYEGDLAYSGDMIFSDKENDWNVLDKNLPPNRTITCAVGLLVRGNLTVNGSIRNPETGFVDPFLLVTGNLQADNIVKEGAEFYIAGDCTIKHVVYGYYNHGMMTVNGTTKAQCVIEDDHLILMKKIHPDTLLIGNFPKRASYGRYSDLTHVFDASVLENEEDEEYYTIQVEKLISALEKGRKVIKPEKVRNKKN